jgi:hypothetical protein
MDIREEIEYRMAPPVSSDHLSILQPLRVRYGVNNVIYKYKHSILIILIIIYPEFKKSTIDIKSMLRYRIMFIDLFNYHLFLIAA